MTNYKIDVDELDKITGGQEPEEFDWQTKGYVTPIKDQDDGKNWHFEAIGDCNEHLKPIHNDQTLNDIQNRK